MKKKTMKFEVVPVEKLKMSKYNPPERVEKGIGSLKKNIERFVVNRLLLLKKESWMCVSKTPLECAHG